MLKDTARRCAVCEELRAELFRGYGKTDSVLCHSDRAVADKPVKSESGDVKHIGRIQNYGAVFVDGFVTASVVLIKKMPVFISVHGHLVRHQRIQRHNFTLAVADYLGVCIAPQQKVRHERFPEDKGTHFRVRLIVQKSVKRMIDSLFFAAVFGISVKVKRQTGDGFRENTDAGIHGRHLHGGAFRHGFA